MFFLLMLLVSVLTSTSYSSMSAVVHAAGNRICVDYERDTDIYDIRKLSPTTETFVAPVRPPVVTDFAENSSSIFLRPGDTYSILIYGRLIDSNRASVNITVDWWTLREYKTKVHVFDFTTVIKEFSRRTSLFVTCTSPYSITLIARKL